MKTAATGGMDGGDYMWPFHQSKELVEFLNYFKNKFFSYL